jgi:hypothetical protein
MLPLRKRRRVRRRIILFICLEKDIGIPLRFFLNTFQGYFQGEKRFSVFQIPLERKAGAAIPEDGRRGRGARFQPGIPGNRVIHDPNQENLETLHGRWNAGLNLHF